MHDVSVAAGSLFEAPYFVIVLTGSPSRTVSAASIGCLFLRLIGVPLLGTTSPMLLLETVCKTSLRGCKPSGPVYSAAGRTLFFSPGSLAGWLEA